MKFIPGEKARARRYAVIVVVGGLHALIILIILAPGTRTAPPDEADESITTALYFPRSVEVPVPPPRTRRPKPVLLSPPSLPVLPEVLPAAPETSAIDATKSIDWMAEGQKAAATIAAAQGRKEGALPAPGPGGAPEPTRHHAGEQYQLETGQKIAWVSSKCYIIIDPPDPFTPNAFAHHALTRLGCSGISSTPRGDLFNQSPTYQKYHPEK